MGKFVVKETKNGGFKFDLKATNGQVIASSQTYKTLETAKKGVASVIANAPQANVEDQTVEGFEVLKHPKFEIYQDNGGEYRFRLKATNGQIIAVSEGYKKMDSCTSGIESVKKNSVDAETVME